MRLLAMLILKQFYDENKLIEVAMALKYRIVRTILDVKILLDYQS